MLKGLAATLKLDKALDLPPLSPSPSSFLASAVGAPTSDSCETLLGDNRGLATETAAAAAEVEELCKEVRAAG